jgi:hypothetical protein
MRALILLAAVASCSSASQTSVGHHGDDLVISWHGGGARLCVTEASAQCPVGKDERVTGGKAFWVIDAICFNGGGGFSSPVVYGRLPECAKDVSAAHGGAAGGEPLVRGRTYKISVVGFGGDPSVDHIEW